MPYTMEDFRREVALEHLPELNAGGTVSGLTTEDILKRSPAHEIEA